MRSCAGRWWAARQRRRRRKRPTVAWMRRAASTWRRRRTGKRMRNVRRGGGGHGQKVFDGDEALLERMEELKADMPHATYRQLCEAAHARGYVAFARSHAFYMQGFIKWTRDRFRRKENELPRYISVGKGEDAVPYLRTDLTLEQRNYVGNRYIRQIGEHGRNFCLLNEETMRIFGVELDAASTPIGMKLKEAYREGLFDEFISSPDDDDDDE